MSEDDVSRTPPSPASTLSPPPSSSSTPPLPSPQPQQQRTLHQNSVDPNARWLVQKFGGTSVGKFPVKIARGIVSKYIDANRVAVVCSARSGTNKAAGTTNLLLRAASQTLKQPRLTSASNPASATGARLFGAGCNGYSNGNQYGFLSPSSSSSSVPASPAQPSSYTPPLLSSSTSSAYDVPPAATTNGASLAVLAVPRAGQLTPEFNVTIDMIRAEHLSAARGAVQDEAILQELEGEIERDCDWLRNFLFAAHIIDEISPRSTNSIIGLGERLACKIMTAVMRDQGIDAEYVSLEDIVPVALERDGAADNAPLDQPFFDRLAAAVSERIQLCGARVPVVTGYFGAVPGSLLEQVGRGYTDVLAALLAGGVGAAELQIWKEVDGIFTADPRKVPTARLLPVVSPDEAAELTYYGSEVIHPFAMEQAIKRKIPIRIKNVDNPRGGGTVIYPDLDVDAAADLQHGLGPFALPEPPSLLDPTRLTESAPEHQHPQSQAHRHRVPTAVTIKERVMVLNVSSNRKSLSHGFLAQTFGTLHRFGVAVDLISTSEVHVSMAISDELPKKVLGRLVSELNKCGQVSAHGDMAILSLVGRQMRNMVGIAGRMFTTLARGNVNIEMISQGASEINISCVIARKDAVKALNLIHQSCLQVRPEAFAKSNGSRPV